jgi:protein-tyrosine phosphatase
VASRNRDLLWDGCLNVRDLGGHPIAGGGRTRYGAYVRADALDGLSDAGWRALVDYGVRTIVDLRRDDERTADWPRDLPLVALHRPLTPAFDPEWERITRQSMGVEPPESTRLAYVQFLERYRTGFGEAVTTIAGADGGGAVLFHCMAGKDRTGMIAALLLTIAGVERAAISADYALSGSNLRAVLATWIAEAADEDDRTLRTRIGAAPAEAMAGALDALDDRYGGAEGYLRAAGVDGDLIDRVRMRLVA